MIVYVGIGRASFLINIVRFDLERATAMRNVFSRDRPIRYSSRC